MPGAEPPAVNPLWRETWKVVGVYLASDSAPFLRFLANSLRKAESLRVRRSRSEISPTYSICRRGGVLLAPLKCQINDKRERMTSFLTAAWLRRLICRPI